MDFDVVIFGSGISGLAVAQNLQSDFRVVVLEENATAGGLALQLGCKATSECLYCGVCRALALKRDTPGFPILLQRKVRSIAKQGETFVVETDQEIVRGESLVIATGAIPFDARKVPNLGWKRFPNIYTGFEVEAALNQGFLQEFRLFKRVAFIQCVGSRNFKEQRGYCSQVCCRYALRLAENLAFLYPQLMIDFYYMDLQILGKKTEKLWEITRKIQLIRQIPFEVREKDGRMVLLFESTRVAESQPYDALILSVGMVPSPGTRQIGEMLQLNFTPEGFVRHYGEVKTSREGVWVCGTACGPKDIETSLEEAYRVSQAIRREKGGRKVEEGTLALRG